MPPAGLQRAQRLISTRRCTVCTMLCPANVCAE